MANEENQAKPKSIIKNTSSRAFQPMILQTKEELMTAMRNGQIKSSKYNLLNESEKMFVELVCFGGYTGEQAVRVINPSVRAAGAIANRMLANPDVVATIEELTVAKDMKFKAEVASAREMALNKLLYIMSTTDDQSLAASCAKVIMDKSEAAMKSSTDKEEPVGSVRFQIQVENVYTGGASPKQDEPVIIELKPEEIDPSLKGAVDEVDKAREKAKLAKTEVNPETGLAYVLNYEGVDNYH